MTGVTGDLVETMRFDPVDGVHLLERHLARLKASADVLGYAFDRHDARNALHAATFRLDAPAGVRLLASRGGAIAIEARALPPPPAAPVTVAVTHAARDDPRGIRLTGSRGAAARAAAGTFEILFADAAGHVVEGSFTTVFVARGGLLLTPPGADGVLRAELLETGRAAEAALAVADLADGFLLGNAHLGLVPARLA